MESVSASRPAVSHALRMCPSPWCSLTTRWQSWLTAPLFKKSAVIATRICGHVHRYIIPHFPDLKLNVLRFPLFVSTKSSIFVKISNTQWSNSLRKQTSIWLTLAVTHSLPLFMVHSRYLITMCVQTKWNGTLCHLSYRNSYFYLVLTSWVAKADENELGFAEIIQNDSLLFW